MLAGLELDGLSIQEAKRWERKPGCQHGPQ